MGLTRLGKIVLAGILTVMVAITALIIFLVNNKSEEVPVTDQELYTGADVIKQEQEVPQPEANITRLLIQNDSDSPEKTAYLTFDDGPTENTLRILDTLKQYGVKATFFVLGEKAEKNPEILTRVFEEGHTIANHTYNHDYNEVYGTREEFENELLKWEEAVGNIIGQENVMKLLRFPGGSKDEWKYIYRNIAAEMGYKYVDWTALNGDADGKPFSEERCMEEIKKYCTDQGDVIILMHDSAKKTITADMMPQIIEYLINQGYQFKRIEI